MFITIQDVIYAISEIVVIFKDDGDKFYIDVETKDGQNGKLHEYETDAERNTEFERISDLLSNI